MPTSICVTAKSTTALYKMRRFMEENSVSWFDAIERAECTRDFYEFNAPGVTPLQDYMQSLDQDDGSHDLLVGTDIPDGVGINRIGYACTDTDGTSAMYMEALVRWMAYRIGRTKKTEIKLKHGVFTSDKQLYYVVDGKSKSVLLRGEVSGFGNADFFHCTENHVVVDTYGFCSQGVDIDSMALPGDLLDLVYEGLAVNNRVISGAIFRLDNLWLTYGGH
jgi:hypothetical protein